MKKAIVTASAILLALAILVLPTVGSVVSDVVEKKTESVIDELLSFDTVSVSTTAAAPFEVITLGFEMDPHPMPPEGWNGWEAEAETETWDGLPVERPMGPIYGEICFQVVDENGAPAANREVYVQNHTTGQEGAIVLSDEGRFYMETEGTEDYTFTVYSDHGAEAAKMVVHIEGDQIVQFRLQADFGTPNPAEEPGTVLGPPAFAPYFEEEEQDSSKMEGDFDPVMPEEEFPLFLGDGPVMAL